MKMYYILCGPNFHFECCCRIYQRGSRFMNLEESEGEGQIDRIEESLQRQTSLSWQHCSNAWRKNGSLRTRRPSNTHQIEGGSTLWPMQHGRWMRNTLSLQACSVVGRWEGNVMRCANRWLNRDRVRPHTKADIDMSVWVDRCYCPAELHITCPGLSCNGTQGCVTAQGHTRFSCTKKWERRK